MQRHRHHRGLTLIELVIAIMVMSFVVIALFSIYISVIKLFNRQRVSVANSSEIRIALDDITNSIRQAEKVVDCTNPSLCVPNCTATIYDSSCGSGPTGNSPLAHNNYKSDNDSLVLNLWPLNEEDTPNQYQSNCTSNCFRSPDSITYWKANNTKTLYKMTARDDGSPLKSKRIDSIKVLAKNIDSIAFTYNNGATGNSSTTDVTVTITSEDTTGGLGKTQEKFNLTRSDKARLRNKLSTGSSNLVGYWNFNNNLNDLSGHGLNGTNINNASYLVPPSYPNNKDVFAQAISITSDRYTGGEQYISVPDSDILTPQNAITVEAWIKLNDYTALYYHNFVYKVNLGTTDYSYQLFLNNQNIPSFVIRCNQPAYDRWCQAYGTELSDNSWHHLAGVYDGSQVCIFVDGNQALSCYANNQDIKNAVGTLKMGTLNNTGWIASGGGYLIDDVRIYNKALTQAEILYDMANPY